MDIKDIPLPECIDIDYIRYKYMLAKDNGLFFSTNQIKQLINLPCLGAGLFSVVFEYPGNPNYAIKVSSKADTDNWLLFAKYADANPSKHFVKTGTIHRQANVYAVVIERLESWKLEGNVFGVYDPDTTNGRMSIAWNRIVGNMTYIANKGTPSIIGNTRMFLTYGMNHRCTMADIREHKQLLLDGMKCLKHFNKEDVHLDLHKGNVMMRKNGDIVITDPIC